MTTETFSSLRVPQELRKRLKILAAAEDRAIYELLWELLEQKEEARQEQASLTPQETSHA